MTPFTWRKELLDELGLEYSDGRPLYQYRVTQDQFNSLKNMLKLASEFGAKNVLNIKDWDACFVIYSAEWWRRHYSGRWGWDDIFSSVGVEQINLSAAQRSLFIQSGLRKWKRDIRKKSDGGRQFLVTIATEGGLPLHQLAASDSGGWLSKVLRPVLSKHLSLQLSISTLLHNYKDYIPASYQSDGVLALLEDIVTIIAELRIRHSLGEQNFPVDWLGKVEPRWREQFPLPLEDDVAVALLNDLINTAAKEKVAKSQSFATYEYALRKTDGECSELVLHLDIAKFLYLDDIKEKINNDPLTACQVEVVNSDQKPLLQLRGICTTDKGKDVIRLSGKRSLRATGAEVTGAITWNLISMGKIIFSKVITDELLPENSSPWTFKPVDESWSFVGAATCRVNTQEALVYLPKGMTFELQGSHSSFCEYGGLLDGRLFRLSGAVTCAYEGDQFKVSTGGDENAQLFFLSGRRLSESNLVRSSSPSEIYLGSPGLVEVSRLTGVRSNRHSAFLARLVGSKAELQPVMHARMGVNEVRHLDSEKNVLLKKRIGILKEGFELKILPTGSDSGYIKIQGVSGFEVNVVADQVLSTITVDAGGYDIFLRSEAETPPRDVKLLLHPSSGRELTVTIPFPAKGAFLFDPDGQRIEQSTPLFLGDLMGYRVRIQEPHDIERSAGTLEFQLEDSQMDYRSRLELYIREYVELSGQLTEFSVYDWVPHIESLLNISANPDAVVNIIFYRSGQSYFQLKVRRFASLVEPEFSIGTLMLSERARKRFSEEVLAGARVQALYLQQPAQNSSALVQGISGHTPLGRWAFNPESRAQGAWILYPSKESSLNFRPVLWNVGDYSIDSQEASSLGKATGIKDSEQRAYAISLILRSMSRDSKHPGWYYIDDLWDKTSHLPLSTFDIWKVSITEPDFLVALFLQGQSEILERIEQELPLLWELIPLDTWIKALAAWKEEKWALVDYDNAEVDELLAIKIHQIGNLAPSMHGVEKLLLLKLLKKNSPEISAINQIVDFQINNSKIALLRKPDVARWPELLASQLHDSFFQSPCSRISPLIAPNNFQCSVMYLPAVLAQNMLVGKSHFTSHLLTSVDIFKVKQIKRFDPGWFDSTFQILSVWLHQQMNNERNHH